MFDIYDNGKNVMGYLMKYIYIYEMGRYIFFVADELFRIKLSYYKYSNCFWVSVL